MQGRKSGGGGNRFSFLACGKLCLLQAGRAKKRKTQKLLSVFIRDLKLQFDSLNSPTLWVVAILLTVHRLPFLPQVSKTGI